MLNLFKKWFCLHSWKTHAKEKYEWKEIEATKGTSHWYDPKWQEQEYSEVVEILICEKCGKINKVSY